MWKPLAKNKNESKFIKIRQLFKIRENKINACPEENGGKTFLKLGFRDGKDE